MRLLYYSDAGELRLTNDIVGDEIVPLYAILSHTWQSGQEVTFQDFQSKIGLDKDGCKKLKFCAEKSEKAGLSHFWVDTCCIDKTNSTELQEAITSVSLVQKCRGMLCLFDRCRGWPKVED